MTPRIELVERGQLFTSQHRLQIVEQLGRGIQGIVFAVESQTKPQRSAIKVHERKADYCRERDAYLRLQEHGVVNIHGCDVPQLLGLDDELWIIPMTVVSPPFVLDFAGAYLDKAPDFSDEVLADWQAEKQEQFGRRWPQVLTVLGALQAYGVYMVDVNPGNISWGD